MFYSCESLTHVYHFYPENAQNISFLFYNCYELTYIDFINSNHRWKNKVVTDMEYMFFNCTKIISINLENFYTKNVIKMNNMFYNCINLNYLNLDNLDTNFVTNMSYMFFECSSLISLNFNPDLFIFTFKDNYR